MIYEMNGIHVNIESDETAATCVISLEDDEFYQVSRQHSEGNRFDQFAFFNEVLEQFCANPDHDYHRRIWVNTALFHATVEHRPVFKSDKAYRARLDDINQQRYQIHETWACPINH